MGQVRMGEVLDKIRKLIGLAMSSESVNEACVALEAATRLMREHGLLVRDVFFETVVREVASALPQSSPSSTASAPSAPSAPNASTSTRVGVGVAANTPLEVMARAAGEEAGRQVGHVFRDLFGGRRRRR